VSSPYDLDGEHEASQRRLEKSLDATARFGEVRPSPLKFYYFERQAHGTDSAGVTVSKTETLPSGDFQVDEFCWPDVSLWFIADQSFSADERQEAYRRFTAEERL